MGEGGHSAHLGSWLPPLSLYTQLIPVSLLKLRAGLEKCLLAVGRDPAKLLVPGYFEARKIVTEVLKGRGTSRYH